MYINLKVKFLPKQWERNFSAKEAEVIDSFVDKLAIKPAKDLLKKDKVSFDFRLDDEKRETILDFAEKNKSKVDICMYADTVYEPEDFEKASAFIPVFPKSFNYYDDWNEEKYASFIITCAAERGDRDSKACGTYEHTEKIFAKPNTTIKKAFDDKYAGATAIETSEASIVSEKLAEHLIEAGVDKEFFAPVNQRRGDVWAYFLDGRKNLIKSGNLLCNMTEGPVECPLCGKHIMKKKMFEREEALEERLPGTIILGNVYECDCWEIAGEAAEKLQPVNMTEDFFFSANQMTVISRELFELIKEKVPEVVKKSIPVFKK